MKYYTKNWYKQSQIATFLMFPETKQDWNTEINFYKSEGIDFESIFKENLNSIKLDLLNFLPEFFHVYINNGTINSEYPPEILKINSERWIQEFEKKTTQINKKYNEHYNSIKDMLPQDIVTICEKKLHDSVVKSFEYISDNTFVLILNTSNTVEHNNNITIRFIGVKDLVIPEKLEGLCWIYDEIYLSDGGFELNILFDTPLTEFKICAKKIYIEGFLE